MGILFAIIILIGLIFAEAYLIFSYIRSSYGQYPPYCPSFGQMKKTALREASTILQSSAQNMQVIDLGSGDGRLLRPLAATFPQHHFCGYEWSWLPYKIAKFYGRKLPNLEYKHQNFMPINIKNADLIICFLSNEISTVLSAKLSHELRPGTLVISSAFAIPGLRVIKEITTRNFRFLPIKVFIYQI